MADKMFDGFDHTQYQDEVEQRWGKESYAKSDAWWRGLPQSEKDDFMLAAAELIEAWKDAAASGVTPDSEPAQQVARRQYDWLSGIPGHAAQRRGRRVEGLLHRAWPRCTSPTSGSRRTTGPTTAAPSSCVTRCWPFAEREL